jgi:hypothetical protein
MAQLSGKGIMDGILAFQKGVLEKDDNFIKLLDSPF